MTTMRATLRLQFQPDFPLDRATELAEYFANLGVSHVYASPLWTPRSGSMHGYDIVDPTRANPELGGEPALRRLVAALRERGMGLLLDIVPNHMGVGGTENAWWQDVLEWGPTSAYAQWFDIDWAPADPGLQGKLLAPFLGQSYGQVLEAGELALACGRETGRLHVAYFSDRFPVAAGCYAGVLVDADADDTQPQPLREVAQAFRDAEDAYGAIDREAFAAAQARLAEAVRGEPGASALDTALERFSAATEAGRERLHALLEKQHYRLALWRTAADEINWRRFFEVNELAGLQVERPEVFEAVHAFTFALYAEGLIDGVRIDHVDGLTDPEGYGRRLRQRLAELQPGRPSSLRDEPAYVVVEKILAADETLPAEWHVDGTTGYDFMDQVGALLHDPAGEAPLAEFWVGEAGGLPSLRDESQAARRELLAENLAGELNATVRAFHALALDDLATRDMTLPAISRALTEFLVHLRLYRVYLRDASRSEADRIAIDEAVAAAAETLRSPDGEVLAQLGRWLHADGEITPLHRRALVRFEHLTPPLAAKSVEDTAFYRYGRLLSRNEVGSGESPFSLSVEAFHALAAQRLRDFPRAMLATSTHDHKRGADLRARLAVLSERPEQWCQTATRWRQLNEPHREAAAASAAEGAAANEKSDEPAAPGAGAPVPPTADDELMLYQMLVGAWSPGLQATDREGLRRWAEAIAAWQTKSLREAQRRSSWAEPSEAYEATCRRFLMRILGIEGPPGREATFLEALSGFVQQIELAGAVNGLTQSLLHLTTPGVPDIYQGSELWDFTLVDPDNRAAVDFARRIASLEAAGTVPERLADWRDGSVKQALVARALAERWRHEALFAAGSYLPLDIDGPLREHALAFARQHGDDRAVVVCSLRVSHLLGAATLPLVPAAIWEDSAVVLPEAFAAAADEGFVDALCGQRVQAEGGRLRLDSVLAQAPVALLMSTR